MIAALSPNQIEYQDKVKIMAVGSIQKAVVVKW